MKICTICFLVTETHIYLAPKIKHFAVGYLNGYGGEVESGETEIEGAIREVREECTVVTVPDAFKKVAEIDFFEGDQHKFFCPVFFVSRWIGTPQATEEMGTPEIFPRTDPPLERMLPGDCLWVPRIANGEKLKGFLCYAKGMQEVLESEFSPL